MSRKLLMAATGAAALFAVSPAFAQTTASTLLDIDMTIQPSCLITGNIPNPGAGRTRISFGTVNPLTQVGDVDSDGSAQQGTAGYSITCNTTSTIASFQIDGGKNASGGSRRMDARLNPGSLAAYELYSDAGRSVASRYQIGVAKPFNGGSIVPGTTYTLNLFGRVTFAEISNPALVADNYDDLAIGTLTF